MDLGIALTAALIAVVLLAAIRSLGHATELIGGLFRPPELGWPSGVQEDDDVAWSWGGARPAARPGHPAGDAGVTMNPVRGHLRGLPEPAGLERDPASASRGRTARAAQRAAQSTARDRS